MLCPITAVAFDDQDAVDACRAVVQRIPLDSLLAALADSVAGRDDWRDIGERTGPCAARRDLRLPPRIDGIADLSSFRSPSVGVARSSSPPFRADVRTREPPVVGLLRQEQAAWGANGVGAPAARPRRRDRGAPFGFHEAAPPEYDQKRFAGYLASEGIDQGSRRWKEMHRRAAELVRYLSEVVETQHAVRPWDHKDEVALLRQVPFEVESQIGATAALLLVLILDDGSMDSEGTIAATAAALQDAGTATDALGRARLAAIADRWIEQTGA